jgi:hypothetical protein
MMSGYGSKGAGASKPNERTGLSDLFGGAAPTPAGDAISSAPVAAPLVPAAQSRRVADIDPDGPAGHRERLRDRFMAAPDAIPDYELLEMLLYRVFPRGDTKPLAKALLRQFGSFAEVLNAPAHRLKEVKGIGDRAIEELAIVRAAAVRLVRADAIKKTVFGNWQAVIDYCMTAQASSGFAFCFSTSATNSLPTRCSRPGRSITRRSMCVKF